MCLNMRLTKDTYQRWNDLESMQHVHGVKTTHRNNLEGN